MTNSFSVTFLESSDSCDSLYDSLVTAYLESATTAMSFWKASGAP